MVKLFYTTFISVDLAFHEIVRAKVSKCGIIRFNCLWILEFILLFVRKEEWFDLKQMNVSTFIDIFCQQ